MALIEKARSLRKRMTPQEVKLWIKLRALRPIGLHFRRQAPIGPYIVDFARLRHQLIIECDGGHHALPPAAMKDKSRDDFMMSKGFRIVRIWNSDVDQNLTGVVEMIVAKALLLHPARQSAPPSPGGGGTTPP